MRALRWPALRLGSPRFRCDAAIAVVDRVVHLSALRRGLPCHRHPPPHLPRGASHPPHHGRTRIAVSGQTHTATAHAQHAQRDAEAVVRSAPAAAHRSVRCGEVRSPRRDAAFPCPLSLTRSVCCVRLLGVCPVCALRCVLSLCVGCVAIRAVPLPAIHHHIVVTQLSQLHQTAGGVPTAIERAGLPRSAATIAGASAVRPSPPRSGQLGA